ncbi:tRNA (adenosine(37)-N6)-dimethylallyltransferase MiaA [Wenzhouxiangella sp. AB-CW3]|uniref:tRNA (adenosine(37)-N6)-dimethylallyltransferase MiaA n=1 Tax=Wenzhouxiangella sp. AB-CW3 TaxID=2771012 RepID=UPI00168AC533|nr:tRNA (adenosine(37)-N6)-dimethylallyltransferase MiaA [Wenzhouxiangella sp. AB-CW3]QOC21663.1 tRNA (adenosine(37)-N6)-dimethylallyltransferase MiaA [Wenzhouxiangella sp. AB-CW3]
MEEESLPPALLLTGPTAAGKTGVALALARRFPVALISVDSAQVYRGLDIGSAKPDAATQARFPHALIDIREPEQTYSAADFVADAAAQMRAAAGAGQLPVLVGGTTLYLRALLYGLDPMPAANSGLRRDIAAEADRRGWQALYDELTVADPRAAERIRPNDTQRIQRGIEVLRLTGRGPSAFHRENRIARFDSLRLVLTAGNRRELHERIARRFDAMLAEGLVEEVANLRRRPELSVDHPAMRSVGYRQVWQHLDGLFSLDQARQRALAATRQLAKRQLTSLRQLGRALWHDPRQQRTINLIFRQVGQFEKRAARAG